MIDLFNLPSLNVLSHKYTDKYYITAEMANKPGSCPNCDAGSDDLIGYGHKDQVYHDIPIHGKLVGILLNRRRYLCTKCRKTFWENLPDVDTKRNITKRLLRHIEEKAITKTFTGLAAEVGVSESTVRRIFHDYFTKMLKYYHPETPRWLGIDEAHLLNDYRCVLTNIEESCILDLLNNRNKAAVVNYLSSMPNRNRVEFVCMDMWQPYRDAVEYCLPRAHIVVDKYHVVRGANKALDSLRKEVGQSMTAAERRKLMHSRFLLLSRSKNLDEVDLFKLDTWLCQQTLLKKAYELKEEFFDIFDNSEDRQSAMARYISWERSVVADPVLYNVFKELITSMANWKEPIFNYFDTLPDNPLTNAFTESLNGVIKQMNQTGKGYSFNVLRAKILFYSNAEKVKNKLPAYRKDDFAIGQIITSLPGEYSQKRSYGIHIPTLLHNLEEEAKMLKTT